MASIAEMSIPDIYRERFISAVIGSGLPGDADHSPSLLCENAFHLLHVVNVVAGKHADDVFD
jgi:hypothetical protein